MRSRFRLGVRRHVRVALACSVALGALLATSSPTAAEANVARFLVKFKAGASASTRTAVLASAGAREQRVIAGIGVRVVTVPAGSAARALAKLRGSRDVAFAEADAMRQPQELLPSDPSFPTQYAVGGGAWGWYKTRTTQAWDITRGDPSVVIAIVDTGLKTQGLDDFSGQVVSGWNVLTGSSDTASNAGNHGTYVAGVAGLRLDNGIGNAGYCPRCKIMPVQVGTDSGASDSSLAAGIVWAADHGARVVNLSWAGPGASSTLANAVAYARSKGVVVVAAAGNSNCDCRSYPAATPGVIGVAGTTNTDAKQGDSNYGTWVTVAAPESNMTAWPTINGAPGYAPVGGTSLAAPVVAGIAGLLFSARPSLTGGQVEQTLEQTAVPVPFPVAYGRVDALAALTSLGFSDPQPSSLPVNSAGPQMMLETNGDWNYVPLTAAPRVSQVLLRGQGSWTGSAPLSLSAVKWQRCDVAGANCTVVGTSTRYTVQSADSGYTLKLAITVKNDLGSKTMSSAPSQPVGAASPAPSAPPASTSPPVISGSAVDGQTLAASAGAWTNSPTGYAYQWKRCNATGASCASISAATASSYNLVSADVGSTIRVQVTATNAAGSAASTSAQTAVAAAAPQTPPVTGGGQSLAFTGTLTKSIDSLSFPVTIGAGEAGATLTFTKSATMTLKLVNGAGAVVGQVSATSSPLKFTLPGLAAGAYTYVVSASGYKGSLSFTIGVTAPSP